MDVNRVTPNPLKPVVASFLSTGNYLVSFIDAGGQRIPVYPFPDQAVRALAKVIRYAEYCRGPRGHIPDLANVDCGLARTKVRQALTLGSGRLSPDVVNDVLAAVGIRTNSRPAQAVRGTARRIAVAAELDPLFGMVIGLSLYRNGSSAEENPYSYLVSAADTIRITPLADLDCRDMVSHVLSEDMALSTSSTREDLEELLQRLSRLVEEVYEITSVVLSHVEISESGFHIHDCAIAAGVR